MHLSSNSEKVLRSKMLKHDNSQVQVAPYQALPVAGPIITHHRASALKVLEPSPDIPEEVSIAFLL
jgi:histidine decarboxylase